MHEAFAVTAGNFVEKKLNGPGYVPKPGDDDWKVPKEGSASKYPSTRTGLHENLTSKGYVVGDPSPDGYIVYKGPDGARITIKPTGEVIPTVRLSKYPTNKVMSQKSCLKIQNHIKSI